MTADTCFKHSKGIRRIRDHGTRVEGQLIGTELAEFAKFSAAGKPGSPTYNNACQVTVTEGNCCAHDGSSTQMMVVHHSGMRRVPSHILDMDAIMYF